MGWDYEDAEDEYWSTRASSYDAMDAEDESVYDRFVARHMANVQRAKDYGYTDEEVMALDEWPWMLTPIQRIEQYRKIRLATNIDISKTGLGNIDVAAAQARVREARKRANLAREMKARTSPIGEPESLLARAARESKDDQLKADRVTDVTAKKRMLVINKSRTIANLKAVIADAQRELAMLKRTPAEPSEKITTFTVTFPGSRKPYVYVGLRVDGDWKMSGKHFEGSDWTWSGIFNRFEEIHATVNYISTPTEFRHEQIHN